MLAFGRWAEGQIKRWIDYAEGALLRRAKRSAARKVLSTFLRVRALALAF
jgi:hypothetical protein